MSVELADVSAILPGSIATNLPNYGTETIACYFKFNTVGIIKCLNIG